MPTEQTPSKKQNMAAAKAATGGLESPVPPGLKKSPIVHQHPLKKHRTLIASSTSSTISVALGFPLDTIKTRMQAKKHANVVACVKDIYKTEGLRGFMRGCFAPLMSNTLVRTTSFTIYQKAKYRYSDAIGRLTGGPEPLVVVNKPGSSPSLATVACFGAAGATAGSLSSLVACPFELAKNASQLSKVMMNKKTSMDDPLQQNIRKSYNGKGTFRMFKTIVANRGWLGLYSGFRLHLVKDAVGSSLYFATYESVKQALVKYSKSDNPTSPLAVTTAGGVCGVVSWLLVYPVDTAKTRYQQNCLETPRGQQPRKAEIEWFSRSMYRGKLHRPFPALNMPCHKRMTNSFGCRPWRISDSHCPYKFRILFHL